MELECGGHRRCLLRPMNPTRESEHPLEGGAARAPWVATQIRCQGGGGRVRVAGMACSCSALLSSLAPFVVTVRALVGGERWIAVCGGRVSLVAVPHPDCTDGSRSGAVGRTAKTARSTGDGERQNKMFECRSWITKHIRVPIRILIMEARDILIFNIFQSLHPAVRL